MTIRFQADVDLNQIILLPWRELLERPQELGRLTLTDEDQVGVVISQS